MRRQGSSDDDSDGSPHQSRRVEGPLHVPHILHPGTQHQATQDSRPGTRDAATQADGTQLSMRELLQLDTLRELRGRDIGVRREVMREVYLAKLADVFWEANRYRFDWMARLEAQQDFEDQFWDEHHENLERAMHEASSGFMAQAAHELATLVDMVANARIRRPARLRHRDVLAQDRNLQKRLEPHENAIVRMFDDHVEQAFESFLHRDPAGGHRSPGYTRGTRPVTAWIGGRDRWAGIQREWRQMFARPTTVAELGGALCRLLEREVRQHVPRTIWERTDRSHATRERLLRGARSLAHAIDASPSAGLAAIRAKPADWRAAVVGPRWVAWTYARARYPITCKEMHVEPQVPHVRYRGMGDDVNLNILIPPISRLLVQKSPRVDRGTQTGGLGRSNSI